jgi:hypothetical protein
MNVCISLDIMDHISWISMDIFLGRTSRCLTVSAPAFTVSAPVFVVSACGLNACVSVFNCCNSCLYIVDTRMPANDDDELVSANFQHQFHL